MRKIIVGMFVSLDGVIEAPHRWNRPYMNEEAMQEMQKGPLGDLLLGRVTYQEFAGAFSAKTGDAVGDNLYSRPKFVVSTTLKEAAWNNSTLIKGNVAEQVSKLKQQPGEDILILGSGTLVHTLMQHDLIDEYRLWVHPVVLGSGKRLFTDGINMTLKLVETKSITTGVVVLSYQPAGKEEKK